jgi:hypothetical protein
MMGRRNRLIDGDEWARLHLSRTDQRAAVKRAASKRMRRSAKPRITEMVRPAREVVGG